VRQSACTARRRASFSISTRPSPPSGGGPDSPPKRGADSSDRADIPDLGLSACPQVRRPALATRPCLIGPEEGPALNGTQNGKTAVRRNRVLRSTCSDFRLRASAACHAGRLNPAAISCDQTLLPIPQFPDFPILHGCRGTALENCASLTRTPSAARSMTSGETSKLLAMMEKTRRSPSDEVT
jgi:hypothetical protein